VGNLRIFPDYCNYLPNITGSNLCGNGQIVDYANGQKLVRWPNLFFATQDENVLSRLMAFSRYPIRWNPVAPSFINNRAFTGEFSNGVSVLQYCYRPYNNSVASHRFAPRIEAKKPRSDFFENLKARNSRRL
jgi:hypothetical protein